MLVDTGFEGLGEEVKTTNPIVYRYWKQHNSRTAILTVEGCELFELLTYLNRVTTGTIIEESSSEHERRKYP